MSVSVTETFSPDNSIIETIPITVYSDFVNTVVLHPRTDDGSLDTSGTANLYLMVEQYCELSDNADECWPVTPEDDTDDVAGLPLLTQMHQTGGVYTADWSVTATTGSASVSVIYLEEPGIWGEYFAYTATTSSSDNPTGTPDMTQVDNLISMDWGQSDISPLTQSDYVKVKWTGYLLVPEECSYRLVADDKATWTINSTTVESSIFERNTDPIVLLADIYPFEMNYMENTHGAFIDLRWTCQGEASSSTVPEDYFWQRATYVQEEVQDTEIIGAPSIPAETTISVTQRETGTDVTPPEGSKIEVNAGDFYDIGVNIKNGLKEANRMDSDTLTLQQSDQSLSLLGTTTLTDMIDEDGVLLYPIQITVPGTYYVAIFLENTYTQSDSEIPTEISGSPVGFTVSVGDPDPSTSELVQNAPLLVKIAGEQYQATIQIMDAYGNSYQADASDPNINLSVWAEYQHHNDWLSPIGVPDVDWQTDTVVADIAFSIDNVIVDYTIERAGTYTIFVELNGQSIDDTPVEGFVVEPSKPDLSNFVPVDPPATTNADGRTNSFFVQGRDAFDNNVHDALSGDESVSLQSTEDPYSSFQGTITDSEYPGVYLVEFAAPKDLKQLGEYTVNIFLESLSKQGPSVTIFPCANALAAELGEIAEAGQQSILEELSYRIGEEAKLLELPLVSTLCSEGTTQVIESVTATLPGGEHLELDAEQLLTYGIKIETDTDGSPYLKVYSEETGFAQIIFDLVIVSSVDEEPDWADIAFAKITYSGELCNSEISFATQLVARDYRLGMGLLEVALPPILPALDCELEFDIEISGSVLAPELLTSVLTFSSVDKVLKIETADSIFIGQTVQVTVTAVVSGSDLEDVPEPEPLTFKISFKEPLLGQEDLTTDEGTEEEPLQFNLDDFEIPRLTCSTQDKSWGFSLPPFRGDAEKVKVSLLSQSETGMLSFREEQSAVSVSAGKRADLMSGKFCPSPNVQLVFKLETSDGANRSIQSLTVPVLKDSGIVGEEGQLPPLRVIKKKIQADGKLTMELNTPVLWDKMQIGEEEPTDVGRVLEVASSQLGYHISELVSVRVMDDGSGDDLAGSKDIDGISLVRYSPTELVIQVNFSDPSAISKEVQFFDVLEVRFDRPELILQDQTLEQMSEEQTIVTLAIGPQSTADEYQELLEIAESAAKIGWVLQTLEFLGLLSLNKAISSMWSLILTLQFLVVISMWQIMMDDLPRISLKELRIAVFGEFFDNYDFAGQISMIVGLDDLTVIDDGVTEKVGSDRLEDRGGILATIGITQILIVALLAMIIVVVSIFASLRKRCCRPEGKCRQTILKIRRKLFFNPLIQYTYVNALKQGIAFLTSAKLEGLDRVISLGLIAILVILPPIYTYLLCKHDLDSEETKAKYGALYRELRTVGQKKSVALYPFVFLLRRYIFVVLTVLLHDSPILQMTGHMILTYLSAIYILGFDIFEDRVRLAVEVTNEGLLLLASIFILCNLHYTEPEQTKFLGNSIMGVIVTIIVINIAATVRAYFIQREESRHAKKVLQINQFKHFQQSQVDIKVDIIYEAQEQRLDPKRVKISDQHQFEISVPLHRGDVPRLLAAREEDAAREDAAREDAAREDSEADEKFHKQAVEQAIKEDLINARREAAYQRAVADISNDQSRNLDETRLSDDESSEKKDHPRQQRKARVHQQDEPQQEEKKIYMHRTDREQGRPPIESMSVNQIIQTVDNITGRPHPDPEKVERETRNQQSKKEQTIDTHSVEASRRAFPNQAYLDEVFTRLEKNATFSHNKARLEASKQALLKANQEAIERNMNLVKTQAKTRQKKLATTTKLKLKYPKM